MPESTSCLSELSKAPNRTTFRPVNPIDLFRCTVMGEPGGPNRAITARSLLLRKRAFRPGWIALSRSMALLRGQARSWVSHRNGGIVGLADAGERAGPHSWEISSLSLRDSDDDCFPDLLARASQAAASAGAARVFMRLRRDDPLADTARSAGFYTCFSEILYKGSPPPSTSDRRDDDLPTFQKAEPRDAYDLFRLYTAATPLEVRASVGMGFEHWVSSRERCPSRCREFIMVEDEAIRGWVSATLGCGSSLLEITVHPGHERGIGAMVDFGLGSLTRAKAALCLVPEYQVALGRALAERGFEPVSEYNMLVRSIAKTAKYEVPTGTTATST